MKETNSMTVDSGTCLRSPRVPETSGLKQTPCTVETRPLGNTGIELTPLGFGCAAAWAKTAMGKPLISDEQAQKLLEQAYLKGIRYFDTGYNYGMAEERLGKILRNSNILDRSQVVISTKFGERETEDGSWVCDWSADWMRKSTAISMERMGVDYLDMLMCHGGKVEDFSDELLEAMRELKRSGKVRAIGINTFDDDVIQWVLDTHAFDFVMLDFNIMKQDRTEMIDRLTEAGIGVIAGAPMAEALYSNRVFQIRSMKDVWYLGRAVKNFRGQLFYGRKFRFINDVPGISGNQIALHYVTSHPGVSSAVFGTTSLQHMQENIDALDKEIPADILSRIESLGNYSPKTRK